MYKKVFFVLIISTLFQIQLFAQGMKYVTENQLKKIEQVYGQEGKKRLLHFDNMLMNAKNKPILKKLKIVNDFFNRFTYKADKKHWKEKDYWASPFEFIGSGAGDCEDYAIAKYFALRLLGIENSKLKITFGFLKGSRIKKDRAIHVVLNYYHNLKLSPVVLDNVNKRLLIAKDRKDLQLYHSFNIAEIIMLQRLLWS